MKQHTHILEIRYETKLVKSQMVKQYGLAAFLMFAERFDRLSGASTSED